jgi:hypothetical protein
VKGERTMEAWVAGIAGLLLFFAPICLYYLMSIRDTLRDIRDILKETTGAPKEEEDTID